MKSAYWLWLIGTACIVTILVSCSPIPSPDLLQTWNYTDLKALDPQDAPLPSQDLIAIYARRGKTDLQIRLDLLETDLFDEFDLYLAVDNGPGGTNNLPFPGRAQIEWDRMVKIPAHGSISIVTFSGDLQPASSVFVIRDPGLQALLIDIDQEALMPDRGGIKTLHSLKLQAFLTQPDLNPDNPSDAKKEILDQSEIVVLAAQPPSPVQVLFTFWDTYPAYTPATSLRRWDGAHTGPNGGRHGLYNLLRTAQAAQIPLFLLDLNQPAALSALDYAGKNEWVKLLQRAGLLTLPLAFPDPVNGPFTPDCTELDNLLQWHGQVADDFGIEREPFLYLPTESMLQCLQQGMIFAYRELSDEILVTGTLDPVGPLLLHPERSGEKIIFPLYNFTAGAETALKLDDVQAGRDGITLEWRKFLLSAALQARLDDKLASNSYINLGGALPDSAWGDPQSARLAFDWLNEHPWVKILRSDDLKGMTTADLELAQKARSSIPKPAQDRISQDLAQALRNAPENVLGEAAWYAFDALYAPIFPSSTELPNLRSIYTAQIWSLLEAANWAAAPYAQNDCSHDPDHDGLPECVLSNSEIYAQFEIGDGSLTWLFAFTRTSALKNANADQLHQIIGPSSQMISGLSDPNSWDLSAGLRADPMVIPGAFSGPGEGYKATIIPDRLIFQLDDGTQKIYHFLSDEIQFGFKPGRKGSSPVFQVPVSLDPWRRFSPGWADHYAGGQIKNQFNWGLVDGVSIQVSTTGTLQGSDFHASRSLFSQPEDPNQDFPRGHFLPFPIALVQIDSAGEFSFSLKFH